MKKVIQMAIILGMFIAGTQMYAQENTGAQKEKKVLMVLSSHKKLGDTGKETGFYLSEATHAYEVFTEAGLEITIISPDGGQAPVDGLDLKDPVNNEYWNDPVFQSKITNTLTPEEVDPKEYNVIYYAGGHGTMWDFTENEALAQIASSIYEDQGVVGAVCHGPSALVNIRLSDGAYLVNGKRVSTFTNEEERAMELDQVVPYLLETRLKERGAIIEKSPMWEEQVSVDSRLVTGQNPASAKKVAEEIVRLLQ